MFRQITVEFEIHLQALGEGKYQVPLWQSW